jgi:receptor expression-enhancing protein 5/6
MSASITHYQAQFEKFIDQPGVVGNILSAAQNKTKVKKAYIAYGVIGFCVVWLMFGYGAQLLCNFIGFLYPAYRSIKALESAAKSDDTQWLMYWAVFALFSVVEFFSDCIVGWVPFYWLGKCAFLVWCMSPLEGSSVIYHRVMRPYFLKHESSIDSAVKKGTDGVSRLANAAQEKAKDYAAEQQLNKND